LNINLHHLLANSLESKSSKALLYWIQLNPRMNFTQSCKLLSGLRALELCIHALGYYTVQNLYDPFQKLPLLLNSCFWHILAVLYEQTVKCLHASCWETFILELSSFRREPWPLLLPFKSWLLSVAVKFNLVPRHHFPDTSWGC